VSVLTIDTTYGSERRETGEARAEWLVKAGLPPLGWLEKQLSERRKGGKGRVKLAWRLLPETTVGWFQP